jgi:hypothetical protein
MIERLGLDTPPRCFIMEAVTPSLYGGLMSRAEPDANGTTPAPPKPSKRDLIEAGVAPVIKALTLFDKKLGRRGQKDEIGRRTAYAISKLVNAACNLYDRL